MADAGDEAGAKERIAMLRRATGEGLEMPAILQERGCDEELWAKVRSKKVLLKMVNAGDEAGAKERIEMLRRSPSITGEGLEMPPVLQEWGCDEELWGKVRTRERQALIDMANAGDEAGTKERIATLRINPYRSFGLDMPPILQEWGCDEELWAKVQSKRVLINMANAGNEAGAKERIAMLRRSPSITGERLPQSSLGNLEMPPILQEWGCDEELWASVRSKRTLIELANAGDEESAKGRIKMLRNIVINDKLELPPILKEWGCNEEMWAKVRSKQVLVDMANAGDEAGAKDRIAMLRRSPTISGGSLDMPPVLQEWGCDEELWAKVRAKRVLIQMASAGDEAGAKER